MNDYDPFADGPKPWERPTRFEKPSPGGRVADDARGRVPPSRGTGFRKIPVREGVNVLESAASALLGLLTRIKGTRRHPDPTALRQQLAGKTKEFEQYALRRGVAPETVRAASYVLRSALDEAVLSTDWGRASEWRKEGLGDALGGERFFSGIETLEGDPTRNLDLLELMYICLSLGFEGKYRSDRGGSAKLHGIRERLYRTIRTFRGEFERQLSPASTPVQGLSERGHEPVPLWAAAGLAGALLIGAYWVFTYKLDQLSEPAFRELNLVGKDMAMPGRNASMLEPKRLNPEWGPSPITRFLQREVDDGLVEIEEKSDFLKVRMVANKLFSSGSAEINPDWLPLLERIAQAISKVEEPVQIIGYTDSDPIFTPRFRSNQRLSQARAEAVLNRLVFSGVDKSRLSARGMDESEPLAPNDSEQNKARNRRVELVVRMVRPL